MSVCEDCGGTGVHGQQLCSTCDGRLAPCRLCGAPAWSYYAEPEFVLTFCEAHVEPALVEYGSYHEAGHALIAVLLGFSLDAVRVAPALSGPSGFVAGATDPDRALYLAHLIGLAEAGQIAEMVHAAERPAPVRELVSRLPGDDRALTLHYLSTSPVSVPSDEALWVVNVARRWVYRVVKAYWASVETLARTLMVRRSLTGDDVRAIIGGRVLLAAGA